MSAWPVQDHYRWLNEQERAGARVVTRHDPDEREWSVTVEGWPGGHTGRGPTLLAATTEVRGLFDRFEQARLVPRGGP